MTLRPVKVGSLAPGLNNRLEPTQLQTKLPNGADATYLYGADNVDINAKGFLRRRRGQTLGLAGRAHSIWGDAKGGFAVMDSNLVQLAPGGAGLTSSVVRTGMPQRRVSYSRGADGDVYWSNGADIRRVARGSDRPVLTPTLDADPIVMPIAGALPAGQYLVVFTVIDPVDGESGTAPPQQVDLAEGSGLRVSGLPGLAVRIYLSGPNGDIPTLAATTTAVSVDLVALPDGGIRCQTLLMSQIPPGSIVRHYNGRMLVAAGNVLHISDPYAYGLHDAGKSYIPFRAPVTVVEPTPNGVYICADVTYWISNLFADVLQEVLPYGGIAGSSGLSKRGELIYWLSPNGLVVGDQNGAAKNVQEDALQFSDATAGASLYRERNGMRHIVTARSGADPITTSAATFRASEIIRKEELL